jgi:hypothetical protein
LFQIWQARFGGPLSLYRRPCLPVAMPLTFRLALFGRRHNILGGRGQTGPGNQTTTTQTINPEFAIRKESRIQNWAIWNSEISRLNILENIQYAMS